MPSSSVFSLHICPYYLLLSFILPEWVVLINFAGDELRTLVLWHTHTHKHKYTHVIQKVCMICRNDGIVHFCLRLCVCDIERGREREKENCKGPCILLLDCLLSEKSPFCVIEFSLFTLLAFFPGYLSLCLIRYPFYFCDTTSTKIFCSMSMVIFQRKVFCSMFMIICNLI